MALIIDGCEIDSEALVRSIAESQLHRPGNPSMAVGSGWWVAAVGAIGSQILCLILWLILADSLAQQAAKTWTAHHCLLR